MNINSVSAYKYNNLSLRTNLKEDSTEKNIPSTITNEIPEENTTSFKGKKPGKVTEFFAEHYGKQILNSKGTRKFCKWVSSMDKKDASRHFQVVGSLVTSGAYMKATLDNKNFDKKNARTLAVNQGACFVLPTIAAYTVDASMANFNKQLEYKFSATQEKKIALGNLTEKAASDAKSKLSKQLKGFRVLIGIVTFTAIYRYLSPVLITPLANWIGNKINAKSDEKEKLAQEQQAKETKTLEISLDNTKVEESASAA